MKAKSHRQRLYEPMLAKTFPNTLTHWLAEQFPHLGGPKVRQLFVTEVMQLIEAYYVSSQHLQPGQTVWYAVDKTDLPRDGRTMAETRLLPVILTLVAREDIERLIKDIPLKEVRSHVVARLHREADAQGGTLAQTDTALLLCQSTALISSTMLAYEHKHQCIIPRRGTVHDLGPSVSHKALIAKKAFQEGKQAPDVAWEADHSVPSTERYLEDLMRAYISLKRWGMTVEDAAFATSMSLSLVKEYAALIEELGLNDDRLSSIMADLEHRARTRQPDHEPDSASRELAPGASAPG